jgi:spore coat protein U-like protein
MKHLLLATAALVGVMAAQDAFAATQTTNMAVTATVSTVCSVSTTALPFNEVALSGVTAGTATVSVTCTNGGTYDVGLDNGLNGGGTARVLASGTDLLNYDLFQDTLHASRWGNTVGTDTVAGVGNGAVQDLTVYGQITAGQTLTTGSYTDTVLVTVTY